MLKFATLLAISTTAYGLAFDGPLPTPVKDLVYAALDGFTPKPTYAARAVPDLFRRQKANSAVCGYLEGDSDFPLSCTAGSCIYSASQKWFGCCSSGSSCGVVTRCVNSASLSKCLEDSSCYNDPLAMACTASSAPFCVNMNAKIAEGTMTHWVCGATATSVAVLPSTTHESSSASGSAKSRTAPLRPASAAQQDNGGSQSTGAAGALSAASATARSTGGAAMHTAGAVAGLAGGIVGAFAIML